MFSYQTIISITTDMYGSDSAKLLKYSGSRSRKVNVYSTRSVTGLIVLKPTNSWRRSSATVA